MGFFICIAELVAALVLIAAGFAYVFSPATAKKLLKTAGMWLGVFFGCFMTVSSLTRVHPFGVLLALLAISPIAYVVREQRLHRSERPQKGGGLERTPVAPHDLREDEL
jgi:hypothetical protein